MVKRGNGSNTIYVNLSEWVAQHFDFSAVFLRGGGVVGVAEDSGPSAADGS